MTPASTRPPLLWWDVAFVAVIVLLVIPVGFRIGEDDRFGWVGIAALAVFGATYLLAGRSELRAAVVQDRPITPRGHTVILLLTVALGVGSASDPFLANLQVLAYPYLWVVTGRYPFAIFWSLVTGVAAGFGMAYGHIRQGTEDRVYLAFIIAAASVAFSVFMGSWIWSVYKQSERYRALAERLRRTQEEVAILSQETGAAAERERFSRDLHDTLTQTLTGLVMLSEQAERALTAKDHALAEDRVARVLTAARDAVTEARALVASTQPLGDGGLEESIERVASRLQADTGITVTRHIERTELGREQQVVLLRAVQEGLSNVRKHARASTVELRLATFDAPDNPRATLTISDDGVGYDPDRDIPGYGIAGLRERARVFGGTVSIHNAPSGGATLTVTLPTSPPSPASEESP